MTKLKVVRPRLGFIFGLPLLFLSACAHAQPHAEGQSSHNTQAITFAGWDVYGTDRLSVDELSRRWGSQLQECVEYYLKQDMDHYEPCRAKVAGEIKAQFHFGYADFSLIRYFNRPEGSPVYGTLDIVEAADVPTRMHFTARPTGHFDDPDGLLQSWDEYQRLGFDLLAKGEITGARVDCPAFHCIFGHKHPLLAPYEKVFVEGVAKDEGALREIFLNDANDQHRGNAAFLLAYSKDGPVLVDLLSKRLSDESPLVRNNVIRVFSDIANYHRELTLPMEGIIDELNFPATTDRNKSSAVILGKVVDSTDREKYRDLITKRAVPYLLRMLRLRQPNNHDMAYNALRLLSGQDFGERNFEAWDQWYIAQSGIKKPGPSEGFIRENAVSVETLDDLPRSLYDSLKDHPIVTVGEMHGTNESQKFVLGLLKLFKREHHGVALGLEISTSDQPYLDQFLKDGDANALKKASFFHRDFQDGRSSVAMANLIVAVRQLRHVPIVFYDPVDASGGQDRDTKMAHNLNLAFKRLKKKTVVVLAGNIHSAIKVGTPWDPNYRPMGYELIHEDGSPWTEKNVRAIKIRYYSGSAWVCMSNQPCGDTALGATPTNYSLARPWSPFFLSEDDGSQDGYNATIFVPSLTTSVPWISQ